MWTLAGQVDSLSVVPCARENCSEDKCGCTQLLASQPGGKFVSLIALEETSISNSVESDGVSEKGREKPGQTEEKSAGNNGDIEGNCEFDSMSTGATSTPDLTRDRSLEMNNPQHGIINMRNINVRNLLRYLLLIIRDTTTFCYLPFIYLWS